MSSKTKKGKVINKTVGIDKVSDKTLSRKRLFFEWVLLILFSILFNLFGFKVLKFGLSENDITALSFFILGLVFIFCANLLTKLYDYNRLPEFLSMFDVTPDKSRIVGCIAIVVGVLKYFSLI